MSGARKPLEINCRACGKTALARADPVYDGFQKRGEAYVCTACGHRYPSRETTPFVTVDKAPAIFPNADRMASPRIFKDSERRRCCAYCAHRVVNPFGQRCGLTNREVESTDLCDQFELRAGDETSSAAAEPKPVDPLARLFGE
jgi:hypothetical protein